MPITKVHEELQKACDFWGVPKPEVGDDQEAFLSKLLVLVRKLEEVAGLRNLP